MHLRCLLPRHVVSQAVASLDSVRDKELGVVPKLYGFEERLKQSSPGLQF